MIDIVYAWVVESQLCSGAPEAGSMDVERSYFVDAGSAAAHAMMYNCSPLRRVVRIRKVVYPGTPYERIVSNVPDYCYLVGGTGGSM